MNPSGFGFYTGWSIKDKKMMRYFTLLFSLIFIASCKPNRTPFNPEELYGTFDYSEKPFSKNDSSNAISFSFHYQMEFKNDSTVRFITQALNSNIAYNETWYLDIDSLIIEKYDGKNKYFIEKLNDSNLKLIRKEDTLFLRKLDSIR